MSTHARKFAVDASLGPLARNLRMLGFDTFWSTDSSEDELLMVAASEGRVLLTRSEALFEVARPEGRLRIQARGPGSELLEVAQAFGLVERIRSGKGFFSLCMQCGAALTPVQGHHVHDRIPGSMLLSSTEFFFCIRCERVYAKDDFYRRMKSWVHGLFNAS